MLFCSVGFIDKTIIIKHSIISDVMNIPSIELLVYGVRLFVFRYFLSMLLIIMLIDIASLSYYFTLIILTYLSSI